MPSGYQKGALLRALVEGQYRDVVIDYVTSNGRLAQCYWLQGSNKRFITVSLDVHEKATHPSGSRRTA
jgi:hypothetical protein